MFYFDIMVFGECAMRRARREGIGKKVHVVTYHNPVQIQRWRPDSAITTVQKRCFISLGPMNSPYAEFKMKIVAIFRNLPNFLYELTNDAKIRCLNISWATTRDIVLIIVIVIEISKNFNLYLAENRFVLISFCIFRKKIILISYENKYYNKKQDCLSRVVMA